MPIHYRPDYDAHIAYITGQGRVTFDDCVDLINRQRTDIGKRLHELNDYGLGYGLSRMFDVYLDQTVEFDIFEDYEAALAWVRQAADRESSNLS